MPNRAHTLSGAKTSALPCMMHALCVASSVCSFSIVPWTLFWLWTLYQCTNLPARRVDSFLVYNKTISITKAEIRQSRVICNLRVDMCVVKPRTALIRASRNKCWLSRNYNRMKTNKQVNLTRQEMNISPMPNLQIILGMKNWRKEILQTIMIKMKTDK